jgi:hypothetical protein
MMATTSITSNEGSLAAASAVLEVTATNPEYNQPTLRIKQAGKRGGAASIRIDDPNPDIEFVEIDQIAQRANTKLPFSRTSYRSMVATPLIVSSRLSSCFSGKQRAVISASAQRASLAQAGALSRSPMLPSPRRSIPLTVAFCMSRTERSSIAAPAAR